MTVDETVDLKDDIQDDLRKKFGIFELDMQFITKQRI